MAGLMCLLERTVPRSLLIYSIILATAIMKKNGQICAKEKNKNICHRISSPEDFLNAGIDFDPKEFDELL